MKKTLTFLAAAVIWLLMTGMIGFELPPKIFLPAPSFNQIPKPSLPSPSTSFHFDLEEILRAERLIQTSA